MESFPRNSPYHFNLKRRGIELNDTCKASREREETSFHAIVFCEASRDVWYILGFGEMLNSYSACSFIGFILNYYKNLSKDRLELLCVLA